MHVVEVASRVYRCWSPPAKHSTSNVAFGGIFQIFVMVTSIRAVGFTTISDFFLCVISVYEIISTNFDTCVLPIVVT